MVTYCCPSASATIDMVSVFLPEEFSVERVYQ